MAWQNLRGHDRVVETLRSAIREGRFPHALFFAGPGGDWQAYVRAEACPGLSLRDADARRPSIRAGNALAVSRSRRAATLILLKPASPKTSTSCRST